MSNSNPTRTTRDRIFVTTRFAAAACVFLLLAGCASEKQELPKTENKPANPAPTAQSEKPPAPKPVVSSTGTISNQAWHDRLKEAAGKPPASFEGTGWESMFEDNLTGWAETKFAGHGEVQVESGLLVMNMGDPFTGVNYTNAFPKIGYEIAFDAMRLMGSDFFCGLTMPVGDSFCSLIVGGWGGSLVGISSLDGMDASENETTKYMNFENGRWYRIRLRVTEGRIEGWIDNEKLINVLTKDRRISLRPGEIDLSKPLGVACWQCSAALREIKYRRVDQPDGPPKKY